MGDLKTQTAALVERAKAEALNRRMAAADELEALVLRGDKPKPGDEDRALELLAALGVPAKSFEEVFTLIKTRHEWKGLIQRGDQAGSLEFQARQEILAVDQWAEDCKAAIDREAREKKAPIESRLSQARSDINWARHPRQHLINKDIEWKMLRKGLTQDEARQEVTGTPQ
ncbi:MAG: hypothetical protein AMXMBFR13_29210 [Phycisphaerae bacterium]